jgi:SAM-dependent methyltransferase
MKFLYDEIPYPDSSFKQTHPDRLAMFAIAHGLHAALPTDCRVLELGCGTGWNLIPMAVSLPDSRFTGIDLSARQIESGAQAVAELGLTNLSLKTMDILDIDLAFGEFDYIIAHGIFSWVPPAVRDHILTLCRQNLAPNGVAYISYNAYPGWHLLGATRQMMLWHTRNLEDPLAVDAEAKDFLNFLGAASPPDESAYYPEHLGGYHALMQRQAKYLADKSASFFMHDELSEYNQPYYLTEFVGLAEQHGLRYFADAAIFRMALEEIPEPVREYILAAARSPLEVEQYLDFISGATFRRSLLCRADSVTPALRPEHFDSLYVSTRTRQTTPEVQITDDSAVEFRAPNGDTFSVREPLLKAAFSHLVSTMPRMERFSDLLALAQAQIYSNPAQRAERLDFDRAMLAQMIYSLHLRNGYLIELGASPLVVPGKLDSSKPLRGFAAARFMAAHHILPLTNLRHEQVRGHAENAAVALLPYLDGTRDRTVLLEMMIGWAESGQLPVTENDEKTPIRDRERLRAVLDLNLDALLDWLIRQSLIEP